MSIGSLMLDLEGLTLQDQEIKKLQHPACGGIILFSRNYQDPKQLKALIKSIREIQKNPLLIAVDQEGGRVQRFKEGFQTLPPMAWLGKFYDDNPPQALKASADLGWLMAAELRQYDIDFSFAPVLDIDYKQSSVIGDRAFHQQTDIIAELSSAWASGARDAGMISVGKHFPGHGHVTADSHTDLPLDERPLAEIAVQDLKPFMELVQQGLEGIMPAHVIYKEADSQPAGFSKFWLQTILRKQLGFDGVIFSDDLTMAAAEIAGNYSERANIALQAGCDMVLVCNNPTGAEEVLETLKTYQNKQSAQRLAQLCGKNRIKGDLIQHPRWKSATDWLYLYQKSVSIS